MDKKRRHSTTNDNPTMSRSVERVPQVVIAINEDEDDSHREDGGRRKRRQSVDDTMRAPKHVHGGDWKDMMHITNGRRRRASTFGRPRAQSTMKGNNWIEQNLKKRVCTGFVVSQRYSGRCGCGVSEDQHDAPCPTGASSYLAGGNSLSVEAGGMDEETDGTGTIGGTRKTPKWSIGKNTITMPTDSYGTISFEGSSHQSRAQFARVSFDADPQSLFHLLEKEWRLPPPKLVITIHGGLTNFDLQPKLARLFRKGILKAARSTDAWIITSGLNAGVVKHVAAALEDLKSSRSRSRVLAIGVSPWGILKGRQRFEGKDVNVSYTTNQFNKSRLAELNDRHSYFLFADNGTVGRYGAEVILRKRLESYLALRSCEGRSAAVPVVCVVLEGGAFTVKVVHEYVTSSPRIPVVVCDGSGRAADLLAFTHRVMTDDGQIPEKVVPQLLALISNVFNYDKKTADRILVQLIDCAKQKNLLTVFRLGESHRQDVDHAILRGLLKGKNLTATEQLRLALAWNRADVARQEIFNKGLEWTTADLHSAMTEALCHDRTDFVQLLLENGVSMHRYLTFGRLEHMYNTEYGPPHTLRSQLGTDRKKHYLKLPEVGHAMENLMGNAYKSNYTKDDFKAKYYVFSNRKQLGQQNHHKLSGLRERQRSELLKDEKMDILKSARYSIANIFLTKTKERDDDNSSYITADTDDSLDFTFTFPYSELLIWAVLTKRQQMAKLMWRHGEEAMAKALVACRLYASLSNNASTNFLELEICEELAKHSEEFRKLAIDVLQYCSRQNVDMTLQLLTYELTNWGNETCLSLAALDGNREFLAHPCSQLLLTDLWHGGMRIRNSSNLKVLGCILVPPALLLLEFKSKEELKLQPHTAAEHHEESWESEGTISEESEYSESSSSEDEETDPSRSRVRAHSDAQQPLSFQQLMRDHLPFRRGDGVSPSSPPATSNGIGNAAFNTGELAVKSRSRTISVSKPKQRKSSTKREKQRAESPSEIRRKSTVRTIGNGQAVREYGGEETQTTMDTDVKQRNLSLGRRLREFYSAPITTFWLWSISFFAFLGALIYTLLIETPRNPTWLEWYLFIYTIVWSVEVIRKLVMIVMVDGRKSLPRKMASFFAIFRNGILALALLTFIIAFALRIDPKTKALGRVLIASNSVLWCLKLVDYLSVHRQIGPYVTMASEMIPRMLPILCMLFVALLSFGLIRQSITYPYEDWHWLLLRNIFYKPYYMLYGEVYAPEIDTCGDEVWDTHIEDGIPIKSLNVTGETCVPGYFVVPLFMTVFMIIANVLLMNTMVACCTYVFERNVEITQEIWLFERYRQVMEYESTPCLPPPFTIIYHLYWVVKWLLVKEHFNDRKQLLDASLKLFLSLDEVERLHSFEEESVEDMQRERDAQRQSSNDERIHRTAERSEQILNRLSHMNTFGGAVRDMEMRMENMEHRHREEMDCMRSINSKLEQLLSFQLGGGGVGEGAGGGVEEWNRPSTSGGLVPAIRVETVEPVKKAPRGILKKEAVISDSDGEEEKPRAAVRRRHQKPYSSIADSIDTDLYLDSPQQPFDNDSFVSEDSEATLRRDISEGSIFRED